MLAQYPRSGVGRTPSLVPTSRPSCDGSVVQAVLRGIARVRISITGDCSLSTVPPACPAPDETIYHTVQAQGKRRNQAARMRPMIRARLHLAAALVTPILLMAACAGRGRPENSASPPGTESSESAP